jgi:hypothetical protein
MHTGALLVIAPDCSSFTFPNSSNCKRVQGREQGDTAYSKVQLGNLMAVATAFLVDLAIRRGIHVAVDRHMLHGSLLEHFGLHPMNFRFSYPMGPPTGYPMGSWDCPQDAHGASNRTLHGIVHGRPALDVQPKTLQILRTHHDTHRFIVSGTQHNLSGKAPCAHSVIFWWCSQQV